MFGYRVESSSSWCSVRCARMCVSSALEGHERNGRDVAPADARNRDNVP